MGMWAESNVTYNLQIDFMLFKSLRDKLNDPSSVDEDDMSASFFFFFFFFFCVCVFHSEHGDLLASLVNGEGCLG